jgi:CubicO group peptidase (beta-lactamase class C family)
MMQFLAISTCVALSVTSLKAQELPMAVTPESVGLSSERLHRITDVFQEYVDEGQIAGAVGYVIRNGQIAYSQTWGMRDREAGDAMEADDIFRLYSMTKPIASVGLMMLFEEGKFRLTDPVSRFLPEFRGLEVANLDGDPDPADLTTDPTNRAVTIQDLLRHTSGLTYGLFSNTAVDQLYRDADVLDGTTAEMVTKLGDLPLAAQPGTRWIYSVSTDVVGRLIEVISGQSLDDFLEKRIFRPLKMDDTRFYAPSDKHHRVARLYGHTQGGDLALQDTTKFLDERGFLGGGGGLVGTAPDYARFTTMLLNRGELSGVRILASRTVDLMTTDHLGDVAGPGAGWGFGLGFAVRKVAGLDGSLGSVGEYYWSGLAGTRFWIDPEEDLVGIFMIHILPNRGDNFRELFKNLVYQAITN